MLGKRDPIFWAASVLFAVSLVLAVMFGQQWLLLMVAAYLLRPTLHSLGLARKLADERQLQIQYQASNVGFAMMVIGVIVVMLVLMQRGDHTWEMLVGVLMVGLAARALAGLVLVGDPLVGGVRIIVSIGLLLTVFGAVEGGIGGVMSHVVPGLAVVALGLAGRRWPQVVGYLVLVGTVTLLVMISGVALRRTSGAAWGTMLAMLLIGAPAITAGLSLLRGAAASNAEPESP